MSPNAYACDVSVVIITWKAKQFLSNLLQSIYKHTKDITFEVVVVDNNSGDGTSEMVKSDYPSAKLLMNPTNMGVASARNRGIAEAKGKYIFIIDVDTELFENSIEKLFLFMEENPQCGIVGSQLVDGERKMQYSSRRFPSLLVMVFRRLDFFSVVKHSEALRRHMMLDWDHSDVREVDYVIGACQFIRHDVLNEIGSYDSHIFYGPEDLDMCLRVWNSSRTVVFYPHTKIYHYEQRITKKKPLSLITLRHLYGILYLFWKYRGRIERKLKSKP